MAWGIFDKIKSFGDKAAKTIGNVSKFVQQKVLPTAKKVWDIAKPFVPYGEAIDTVIDTVDDITSKTKDFEDISDLGNYAYEDLGAREWLEKKKQSMRKNRY